MKPQHLPILLFAAIFAMMLIGQRFGFTWAGGEGYEAPVLVQVLEVDEADDGQSDVYVTSPGSSDRGLGFTIARGQTLHTENGRAWIRIGKTLIAVDERTTLEFLVLTEDEIAVRFPRGRIWVERPDAPGAFRVLTNYHESTFLVGTASFVNFDFKEIVSVIPIDTSITVFTKLDATSAATQIPVDIHETEPVTRTNQIFSMGDGAATDFYAWATDQERPR